MNTFFIDKNIIEQEFQWNLNQIIFKSQVISAASGWASWAVGAIGAKFYKSATPPPGSTQPPQSQNNANQAPKDGPISAQNNKPSDRNSKVSSTSITSPEHSQNSNPIKGKCFTEILSSLKT